MRRAPNYSNLFRSIQGPKASILWARPHVRRQPSWSPSAKTEGLFLFSRRRRKASSFFRGEDGRPLPFFEAKPRSNSILALSIETDLSTGLHKVIADETVSRLILALFWRYQVARLMPDSLHGWVADRDCECGRAPAASRLRCWYI